MALTTPEAGVASGDPPLLEAKVVFTVDLHPSRTLTIQDAIRDELNAKLMRFDDELGGVMLAYWRERMAAKSGHVLDIIPYVSVRVSVHVLLFKPRVGTNLVGRVNMVGADHVGLLVCNAFNVSIAREHIRPDLRFIETAFGGDDRARLESVTHPSHVVRTGTDVLFTVRSIVESEDMLSLTGALRESHTGSVSFLQRLTTQSPETAEEERQCRKRERRAHRAAAEAAAAAAAAVVDQDGEGPAGEEVVVVQAPLEGEQPRRRGGKAVRERRDEAAAAAVAAADDDAPKHKKRRTEA